MKPLWLWVGMALVLVGIAFVGTAGAVVPNHPVHSLHAFPERSGLEDACGIALAEGHTIYASDYYDDLLRRYSYFYGSDPVTHESAPVTTLEMSVRPVAPPSGPCGIAVGVDGSVYVNAYHQGVLRYPAELLGASTIIDSGPATALATDPTTGFVYVDDRTYVAVYEPSGAPVTAPGGGPLVIGSGTLVEGFGVAVAAGGERVYVADAATDTIKVYEPAGDAAAPVAEIDGAGTPQAGFVSLYDSSLAFDQANDDLFVVDNLEPGFERPEAVVDEFNAAGDFRGQLNRALVDAEPSGLAIDASNDFVYATSGNGGSSNAIVFGPASPAVPVSLTEAGAGAGGVASVPSGINCGTACAAEYNLGAPVELTAVADPGSVFVGFSGGGCAGASAVCHVTATEALTVTAEFAPAPAPSSSTAPAVKAPVAAPSAVSSPALTAPVNAATKHPGKAARARKAAAERCRLAGHHRPRRDCRRAGGTGRRVAAAGHR
jgi:hypothetical protein